MNMFHPQRNVLASYQGRWKVHEIPTEGVRGFMDCIAGGIHHTCTFN